MSLWLPKSHYDRIRQEQQREAEKAALEEYKAAHRCCPECFGDSFMSTCMGWLGPPLYDQNNHHCLGCGWHGKRADMVPEPEKMDDAQRR